MIKGGTGGANTLSGAYFEQIAQGKAPGIPVHKTKLREYFEAHTDKLYALSKIFEKNSGVPKKEISQDKWERAKQFEGKFLLTKEKIINDSFDFTNRSVKCRRSREKGRG
jgi:hypothetical protein